MRVVVVFLLAICAALSIRAEVLNAVSESTPPSVAASQRIDFLGRTFELKFKSIDKPVRIYEFFQANDTPEAWLELLEFQIYPIHSDGNEPIDYANRLAAAFKQKYPYMQLVLYSDKNTGAALLDFLFPTSTRKEQEKNFLEFNAFKFFRAHGSSHTMSFHYAKNIEGTNIFRQLSDVSNEIKRTRQEVLPAMALFPVYRE